MERPSFDPPGVICSMKFRIGSGGSDVGCCFLDGRRGKVFPHFLWTQRSEMTRTRSIPIFVILAFVTCPVFSHAQQWSGVLSSNRAIDWSRAGIPGGIPSSGWTQCGSTIASGASASTINAALAACAANHYVQLGAGTFPGGIKWTKSNVALRGMGADQTTIQGSGSTSCFGEGGMVAACSNDGTYANSPPAAINWTAGYAKGTTVLTLSSVSGIVAGQTMLFLDQCDDGLSGSNCSGTSTDNGNYFVCSDGYSSAGHGCGTEEGTNAYRPHRAQIQIVVPVSVNTANNQVTIAAPGLYAPNWRSGQSPQVWIVQPIIQAGLENLSVDSSASGNNGFFVWNGYQCWSSGVRYVDSGKSAIFFFQNAHAVAQSNYIYDSQDSDPYGIQFEIQSDALVVNNIIQQNRSPIVLNGPSTGGVFAYNFTILDQTGSNGNWAFWNHSAGIAYDLWEGNVAGGFANDDIHGSHNMITRFRNYFTGHESNNTGQINPIFDAAYNRYGNVIGNVLGTSSFDTTYQQTSFDNANVIYTIGAGNPGSSPVVPDDSLVSSTEMRWGNYDTVNGAVRFQSSEVPTAAPSYPNAIPASQTLPASFYLSAQPDWWPSGKAWPPIGPDVSSGNIANLGGHAFTIPAQDCYLSSMSGPAAGTGGVLSFNASNCYPSSGVSQPPPPPTGGAPNPPTNLGAVVQ